ncbi:uncharacterized protein LOC128725832 [Anopheles nili]|uniref:uncharacterized protein LOC128725832 n=1 Tax=Anopheles nili TaxID=185578 RepID=UPI00237ADBF8|nr:uncharacterized protein LOC128725832 [Anopheles nili]
MIFVITVLALLCHAGAQNISMSSLDNVPILAFHRGEARITNGNNYYIHRFNISDIRQDIKILSRAFSLLERNQLSTIIEEEFSYAFEMLKITTPIRRSKRWDTIGTVWKFIAGNPDANDLKLINTTMDDLIKNNNIQVRFNKDLTLQLTEMLLRVKDALQLYKDSSADFHSLYILMNLKYLTEKLGLITDSITLAKVGITNPRILNSQETDLMMIDIRKQNITVHTISEALAYTNTKIATNNNELLFIISCPRLRKNILNKIQVYGINNIGKQIHVPHPYYLSHKSQMFIVASLDKEFYNTEDLQEDNTTCIPAIIKGQPASCDFISNPSTQEVITLDRSHLLISSSVWFIFDTTCGIRERNLTGSFIVAYEDCNIFFNNKTISSNTISFPGSPINLPIYELRSEMKQIHLESHSITWKTWSISSLVSTPFIILIAVGGYIVLKICKKRTDININTQPASHTTAIYKPPTMKECLRTEPQI